MGRRLAILVFLCLTLILTLLFPKVWERALSREDALPPGISAPEKRLLRVWLIEDSLYSAPWLKRQAARLEEERGGVSVYLRSAKAQELVRPDGVLPDLILFGPGAVKSPESLFLPLTGDFLLGDGALRAGRWQGMQYAIPVCMDGYVLAYDPALTGAAAATPAPTPLLGIGAKKTAEPVLEKEPSFADLLSALASVPRGKSAVCDFQSAAGMPLMLFTAMSGGKAVFPAGILQSGFGTASQDAVYSDFLSGRCRAAMLPSRLLRSLAAKGKPFAVLMPPLPATDMYLAAGIVPGDGQDLAMAYLQALLSPDGQYDLSQSSLMPLSADVSNYGPDPVFGRVEGSLKGDLILPNAFSHDAQSLQSISHSIFTNGGVLLDVFESIR